MFSKVLVANRGAIARRVIRACNDLGIASVAVFSEADRGAPYLTEASEAVPLGGTSARESYLNQAALLALVDETGVDAVHPGYGFLAESGAFARAVEAAGARFIGPAPRWLETMGDKLEARRLAAAHDFPVFAGTEEPVEPDGAREAAARIGYPLMLKPAAGGGGIGMRVVRDDEELARSLDQARALAGANFGDDRLFLERWIPSARHIEFQLLGDGRGNAMHVFERDCSVQRRHQKVIEESPAPGLAREEVLGLADRAVRFAAELGYDNVGTLETLRSADGDYGFLEMNTRIQVEHGVTEMLTGMDLVAAQIRLAAGDALPSIPEPEGHALEVRVYAEDGATELPSTGRLSVFRPPSLHGVRVDTGYQAGQWVTPHYDPLLAKVIGHGVTRAQAIGRVVVALKAFEIQGVRTNIGLLSRVLSDETFLTGGVDTGWLSRFRAATG
jgi:acetyl-CoA carboxylase biotin carboxylase subunit